MKRECGSCRFYNPVPKHIGNGTLDGSGECRNMPPMRVLEEVRGQGTASFTAFPEVEDKDWCGAYEPGQRLATLEQLWIAGLLGVLEIEIPT